MTTFEIYNLIQKKLQKSENFHMDN